jgi:phosphoglycerol transferase MdoB-like AlkP superfamily enzyme
MMTWQDTYEEQRKEEAQKVVSLLSKYVNNLGHSDKIFVNEVMNEHRTLQQQMFNVFMACISEWAKCYESDRYDQRNEFAVKQSNKIMKMYKGEGCDFVKGPLI